MNPVDEFLASDMEKTAAAIPAAATEAAAKGMSPMRKAFWAGLGTMGAIGAGTIATGAAQDMIDMARGAVTRSLGFRDMIKRNPELKKMDRKDVKSYYNTLHRFSPEIAQDPVVAGSWVRRMNEFDYVDPAVISNLVSTSERMRGLRSKHRVDPFQLAQAGTAAGLDALRESRTQLTPYERAKLEAEKSKDVAVRTQQEQLKSQLEQQRRMDPSYRKMQMADALRGLAEKKDSESASVDELRQRAGQIYPAP